MFDSPDLNSTSARLKYLREKVLKVTRAYLSDKYDLSPDTLAAWENGKIKISDKGINRCIDIYRQEKVIVSKVWLISGEGLSPKLSFDLNRYFDNLSPEESLEILDDSIFVAKEVDFFRSSSSNAVTAMLTDDTMLPFYACGDYVGGRFLSQEAIDNCLGRDCIVKTIEHDVFIRRLYGGNEKGAYHLACLNPETKTIQPVLFNISLVAAAPIIWHRRVVVD